MLLQHSRNNYFAEGFFFFLGIIIASIIIASIASIKITHLPSNKVADTASIAGGSCSYCMRVAVQQGTKRVEHGIFCGILFT